MKEKRNIKPLLEYKETDQLCSYQKSLLYKISQRYKNQKCYLLLYTHYYNYISKGLWEKTGKTKWVTESTPCSNETSFGCPLKWPMFCLFDFALVMALLWRQITKIYSLGLCFESFDEIVFKEKILKVPFPYLNDVRNYHTHGMECSKFPFPFEQKRPLKSLVNIWKPLS